MKKEIKGSGYLQQYYSSDISNSTVLSFLLKISNQRELKKKWVRWDLIEISSFSGWPTPPVSTVHCLNEAVPSAPSIIWNLIWFCMFYQLPSEPGNRSSLRFPEVERMKSNFLIELLVWSLFTRQVHGLFILWVLKVPISSG